MANEPSRQEKKNLSSKEVASLAFSAILKGIPSVGASLDHLIFGSLQELRTKRVEQTLQEMGERLETIEDKVKIERNEDFANLLENVLPPLSRTTNENKRIMFRNLLINASLTPPGDDKWSEATLVGSLLDNIDPPGLDILYSLSLHLDGPFPVTILSEDEPAASDGFGLYEHHNEGQNYLTTLIHRFKFNKPVTIEWLGRLCEMRLVSCGVRQENINDLGRKGWGDVRLSMIAKTLIEWTIDGGD